MPLPRIITKVNRKITNPIARRFAGRIPPFAIVEHHGRMSGKPFRTPVMVFPSGNEMCVALTYGPDVDWVKNVLAAGGCTIEYRGNRTALTDPKLNHGSPAAEPFPRPVRSILRLIRVNDFLGLRRAD